MNPAIYMHLGLLMLPTAVLGAGRQQVTFRAAGRIFHLLIDLKSVKLAPTKE